jgi:16S rRNA (uracil1498-N3)-methyltransferase
VPILSVGDIELAPAQAHHLRDVLRMRAGDSVTAFDDHGLSGSAVVILITPEKVTLRVSAANRRIQAKPIWTVAAAIPKGPRADWMVEKLAELGTEALIPLSAERSVSLPGGKEKLARWNRLASEASRQCGRSGVMRIEPIATVDQIIAGSPIKPAWHLSTKSDATPVLQLTAAPPPEALLMLIGPEGGWTEQELDRFKTCGFTAVSLAETTLRVETAAIAAAAMAAAWAGARVQGFKSSKVQEIKPMNP